MTADRPMSPGEVRALLGITTRTLERYVEQGKPTPFRTPGRERRFHRAEVESLADLTDRHPADFQAPRTLPAAPVIDADLYARNNRGWR